jgi:hypothetical protein
MNRIDFLESVLAQGGLYCAVGIHKSKVNQLFFSTVEEVSAWADEQILAGVDVYFSPATYQSAISRSAKNTRMFKSIWIDLDIGKGTEFASQLEGIKALKEFCSAVKLPKPTIVSSGYGMHIYWAFEEEVDYNDWKPLATALVNRINFERFAVKDKGITTDAARILRIPSTKNFKRGEEMDVEVISLGQPIPIDLLKETLEPKDSLSPLAQAELAASNVTLNETTRALLGNIIYKFSRIMQKSVIGNGCAQLLHIYQNQNEISEPLWRSGLSIAQFCVDSDTAIHKISRAHDEYDPAETERKAALIKGPHLCETFNTIHPQMCIGCKHIGNITTPLMLGRDILEASPADNLITAESKELGTIDIEIPQYPYPYTRGPNGGVYVKSVIDGGDDEDTDKALVYENDFYVVGRRTDPNDGEVLHMRLIRPHDGVSDFIAPLATVTAGDKCRELLSHKGIAAHTNQMKLIMSYLVAWTKHLQNTTKAEHVRVQFGWSPDNASFVIGARELSKGTAPRYSPPSATTQQAAKVYTKEGSLEAWSSVVNTYGLPGNEVRAFALFLSLGAPMFRTFSLGGAMLHLTNASSGVGKSTIQYVANSVWGHPTKTMLVNDDKILAKYQRMGIIQNLILCIDELTNLPADEISDLAFGITNGRGRNRMSSSANIERINNTTWSMPCITSGNNSLHEVLQTLKADPEGEILRILELEVVRADALTKQESDQLFSRDLVNNYGHAGDMIVQAILDNHEESVNNLFECQREFDDKANLYQRDRYYSALVATAIFGGKLANELGIINIPVEPVIDYLISKLGHAKKVVKVQEDKASANLGLFMSEHIQNQLVINNKAPNISGVLSVPIETPRGALVIRREPDTHRAYIISSVMKSWCAKKQISYKCLIDDLKKIGILLDTAKVRMSAGTVQDSPAVFALVLDTTQMV